MYDSIYIKSYINRIYNDRKKISDCLEKEELQRSMRKFVCVGGDGCVHYSDCGDDFRDIYI